MFGEKKDNTMYAQSTTNSKNWPCNKVKIIKSTDLVLKKQQHWSNFNNFSHYG